MAPNIPILCHLATQLSPGDIIAITLTTKTKTIIKHKIVPSIILVSFWLEANQQQDDVSIADGGVVLGWGLEWDYVPTTHTTYSLVPRLLQNVNMRTQGESGISTPSLPLPFFMWQNTTVGSAHLHNFNVCIPERGHLGMRLYYPLTYPSKFELVHSCTSSRFPFILR